MELELGLKITHNRDDITSHADLRIAKDYTGPLFLSKETESMFFIIAYLKGFVRENIDIDINKYGNRIAISGKRAVQEMVLSRWIMHKKDVELRDFRKVFQIPDGINLDRIKAKFNDKESSLTIVMPKLVKGMRGVEIQEVEEFDRQSGQDKLLEEEHYKEPMKEIEESEIEREPEMPRILADEVSTEENFNEEAKEDIEPKIESKEGSDQVETTKEVAEIFPDNSKEMMLQEKPEESKIEKVMAEAEVKPERSVDMTLQKKPETEGGNESDEKVESPPTNQETAAMEPEEVTKEGEIEQPEEKKLNPIEDFPEQTKKQDIPEAESVEEEKPEEHGNLQESTELTEAVRGEVLQQQEVRSLPTRIEQEQETEAEQELKEQETESKVQETKNPEPDKEQFNQAETEQSKEQAKENEGNGQEESHDGKTGNEIEREANDDVKLPEEKQMEELEIEKQKEIKNDVSKGYKLRPPYIVAGSALLVSLIVLVINLIRAKRR